MDDNTPQTPGPTPPVTVPNPHADTPAPTPQDGMRPEAAANPAIRPEQDEPGGPLGSLVGTAATQAAAEATPANADAALLESMGVEGEGIESSQILGLVAGVIFAVIALAVGLIFLFYLPFRQQVGNTASDVTEYPELEQVRTEGRAKLGQYARADSAYQVPIEQAMSVITGRYASGATASTGAAPAGAAAAGAVRPAPTGLPSTRQQWNTLSLNRGVMPATQNPAGVARRTTPEQERLAAESGGEVGAARTARAAAPVAGQTNERVGVDGIAERPAPITLGSTQTTQ